MNDIAKALGQMLEIVAAGCANDTQQSYFDRHDTMFEFLQEHGPTLAALVADGGWLPIETAPSGQPALVLFDSCGLPEIMEKVGATWHWANGRFGHVGDAPPTHWRPLPPPPNQARAGGGCD